MGLGRRCGTPDPRRGRRAGRTGRHAATGPRLHRPRTSDAVRPRDRSFSHRGSDRTSRDLSTTTRSTAPPTRGQGVPRRRQQPPGRHRLRPRPGRATADRAGRRRRARLVHRRPGRPSSRTAAAARSSAGSNRASTARPSPSISSLLDRVLEIDRTSRAARIQAGVYGPALETSCARTGSRCVTSRSRSAFSTLGGWLATRAGGHFATLYTHIDDLTESLRVVTPAGVQRVATPAGSGAGPSPDRLFLGSEGTLGVITEAWMRLQERPALAGRPSSIGFDDHADAVTATRTIAQAGLYPTNCRLLDASRSLHPRRRQRRRPAAPGVRVRRPSGRRLARAGAQSLATTAAPSRRTDDAERGDDSGRDLALCVPAHAIPARRPGPPFS